MLLSQHQGRNVVLTPFVPSGTSKGSIVSAGPSSIKDYISQCESSPYDPGLASLAFRHHAHISTTVAPPRFTWPSRKFGMTGRC